VKIHIEQITN